jgi:hypothetical protein
MVNMGIVRNLSIRVPVRYSTSRTKLALDLAIL